MLAYFPHLEAGISDWLYARDTDHKWITISNIIFAYFPHFEVQISNSLHERDRDDKWITLSNIILGYFAPLQEKK
jgi:hypothetical protein